MTHRCPLPASIPPGHTRAWTCPDCGQGYHWSKRMIGREMHEGWYRSIRSADDFEARRIHADRQFDRFARRLIWIKVANWVLLAILVAAIAWWAVVRLG